jgi:hypothetical protein
MRALSVLSFLSLVACSAASQPSSTMQAAARPVVIELFQSQGCSSCPPALAVLNQEADRKDVIALNFAVTYWDQLGWKDNFARPEYTARQWDYARAAGRANVQTPQLIVDGRKAVLGSRKGEVDAAIGAAQPKSGPALAVADERLTVGSGTPVRATIWIVDYDPRAVAVPIRAGENGGRTLVHRNIVKRLTSAGHWTGKPVTVPLAAPGSGLARAVLVQQDGGGAIIAARKV